jgi:hypothetical protein
LDANELDPVSENLVLEMKTTKILQGGCREEQRRPDRKIDRESRAIPLGELQPRLCRNDERDVVLATAYPLGLNFRIAEATGLAAPVGKDAPLETGVISRFDAARIRSIWA